MDLKLIRSHLQRARTKLGNSYEEFDALWSAFNVMYEATRPELIMKGQKRPSERQMIRYCVKKLDYEEWRQILESEELKNLLSIAPIFNERAWLRDAKIDTKEFGLLVEVFRKGISGNPAEDIDILEALADLLYIIRCNRHHGYKTYDRPRDREVLDTSVSLLRKLVSKLAIHFGII